MARLLYDTLVFPLSSEIVCDYLASTVQLVATRRTNPHCPLEKYPHLMWMTPHRRSRGAGSGHRTVGSRAHAKGANPVGLAPAWLLALPPYVFSACADGS